MADNYLEKRYDEVFGTGKTRVKRVGHTLDELLTRNRSCRGYHKAFVVTEEMLRRVISVCNKLPSARNQQVLRYRLVVQGPEAAAVLRAVKMGGALPELHLPLPGTEPEAFVVVCSTVAETAMTDIDLGIAAQSILLKAVETGLNGLIIEAFDRTAIREALHLPLEPLMVIAIGKGAETFRLVPIKEADDHRYYRQEGIHCVPKLQIDDLLLS